MIVSCDSVGIAEAIKSIQKGGVVVFPTDTVYGLGCDPYNKNAVGRIYKIKNRNISKSFPLLAFCKKDLEKIVRFDKRSEKLAEKFWPGPLTLVLKLNDERLKNPLGLKDKVAVRIPKNDCIHLILKKCRLLVGTSANFSGKNSFTDPQRCRENFSGYDLFVDGGIIPSTGESTIVEVGEELKVLREGVISKNEVLSLF